MENHENIGIVGAFSPFHKRFFLSRKTHGDYLLTFQHGGGVQLQIFGRNSRQFRMSPPAKAN